MPNVPFLKAFAHAWNEHDIDSPRVIHGELEKQLYLGASRV